jgi:hypothetical protein
MELTLLLLVFTLWDALPGLTPEDREVIRNLEFFENLDLTTDLEMFVPPAGEPATPDTLDVPDVPDVPELDDLGAGGAMP